MKTLVALIIAIIVLGGGYYWYSSQQTPATDIDVTMNDNDMDDMMPSTPPSTPATSTATSTPSTGTQTGAVKEFTVTGKNFSFAPAAMTVKKGDTVKITFKNESGTHDLRVDGYKVGTKTLQTGQSETITFVADKAGSFEYYCSIGQHRQMGMKGTLTVQ